MTNFFLDPNDIDWDEFAKSIVNRIEVVEHAWRIAKHDFEDNDYDRFCDDVFVPLIGILIAFAETCDKVMAAGRERMDRMN